MGKFEFFTLLILSNEQLLSSVVSIKKPSCSTILKKVKMKNKLFILLILISTNLIAQPELTSVLLGGNNNDYSFASCFDADDNVIVIGAIRGTDLYITDTLNPNFDQTNKNILIRKYSEDMTQLLNSSIICGSGHDYGRAIAIDSQQNVFIAGFTYSNDFPVTANAYQQTYNISGEYDAYILKLNPTLDTILAATYFGGEGKDGIYNVQIDAYDNVFVTGSTQSDDNIATEGTYDNTYNGTSNSIFHFGDMFVAKFDNNLENCLAATYVGSVGDEAGYSMTINNNNNIVLVGATDNGNYPTTENVYQPNYKGGMDAFVSVLSNDLTMLINSTFVGGNAYDIGWDISYNASSSTYIICGETKSTNYPTTDGVVLNHLIDQENGFISVLSADLQNLNASTYIGGSCWWDILTTVDAANQEIIFGGMSDALDLPTTPNAYDPDFNGGYGDAYFGILNSDLTEYQYLSYLGGNNDDQIWNVAANSGDVYINGTTYSSDFESDSTFSGQSDVFLSRLEGLHVSTPEPTISDKVFTVYPNPVQNTLFFETDFDYKTIRITNILGETITYKTGINAVQQINVSNFKPGTYFIEIDGKTQKFVKQ